MSKTIVITGAGAGLGRAMARKLAREGHRVVVLGRTPGKLAAVADEIGGGAWAQPCDVASAESVKTAFAEIASRAPRIDVLINNAAVYEPFTVAEATDRQITAPILTNLVGCVFAVRAALPLMKGGGHIINVSSESVALRFPMLSLYQASKAGLERFSEALKDELAGGGIRVTVVRAGTMYDEDTASDWPQDVRVRFGAACLAAGLDLRARPASHYRSVAAVIAELIDLPSDAATPLVTIEGFRS
jgi:NAD(P)-dependent dehydrogenase (short-subunit alcohol dehydrogenase family)